MLNSLLIVFNYFFLWFLWPNRKKSQEHIQSGFNTWANKILLYRTYFKTISRNTVHSNDRSVWKMRKYHFLMATIHHCRYLILSEKYSYVAYFISCVFLVVWLFVWLFADFCFFFPEEEKRDKETKIIGRNHLTYVEN